ncbi:MAG: hypothetical protein K6C97_09250 [Treponema sp.]|nr:hypothetical protein [Treponema sp.]
MGLIILIGLVILVIFIALMFSDKGHSKPGRPRYHHNYGYNDYDDEVDFDDDKELYEDFETGPARGDRDYFSDDPARDYASYYAQVADDAMMGDQDAMDELDGEF